MKLNEYIRIFYQGNTSAFARFIGKHRQQVQQWIKQDCIWYQGAVYQPKTSGK